MVGQAGSFSKLLRTGRKRTFEEVEEEKAEHVAEILKRAEKDKLKAIEDLKIQLEEYEKLKMEYLEDESKLAKLFEIGIIDTKGEYVPFNPDDQDEMK